MAAIDNRYKVFANVFSPTDSEEGELCLEVWGRGVLTLIDSLCDIAGRARDENIPFTSARGEAQVDPYIFRFFIPSFQLEDSVKRIMKIVKQEILFYVVDQTLDILDEKSIKGA